MKKIAKVFSTVVSVITILVIIAAATLIVPKFFGYEPFIVESGSMEPVIHTGAIAYINTHDKSVGEGDIVTYKIGEEGKEKLVTHRIIREENGSFITQGDANDIEDMFPVSQDQIVGTYTYSVPEVGFIVAKLGHKILMVIAVWIILINLASMGLTALAEDDKEEEEAKEENPKEAANETSEPVKDPGEQSKEQENNTP